MASAVSASLSLRVSTATAAASSRPRAACPAPRIAARSTSFGGRAVSGVSNGVKVSAWFKFGKNGADAKSAGIIGAQRRDEYDKDDVEQYFNYMGLLAVEGSYDNMYKMLDSGLHPADIILLWASAEGDTPKVEELVGAGADPSAKSPITGMTAFDVAGKNALDAPGKKEEVLALLGTKK